MEALFWESKERDSTAFYYVDTSSFLNSQLIILFHLVFGVLLNFSKNFKYYIILFLFNVLTLSMKIEE